MDKEFEKYMKNVPSQTREVIWNLSASVGLSVNNPSGVELCGFIQGAAEMYLFLQGRINELEVQIDLLEGESNNKEDEL